MRWIPKNNNIGDLPSCFAARSVFVYTYTYILYTDDVFRRVSLDRIRPPSPVAIRIQEEYLPANTPRARPNHYGLYMYYSFRDEISRPFVANESRPYYNIQGVSRFERIQTLKTIPRRLWQNKTNRPSKPEFRYDRRDILHAARVTRYWPAVVFLEKSRETRKIRRDLKSLTLGRSQRFCRFIWNALYAVHRTSNNKLS